MEFVKNNIAKWASALVVLIVGILCIVVGASGFKDGSAIEGISITIGVALLVVAGLVLVLALVATIMSKGEAKFLIPAIAVSATLALGLFFVINKGLGAELINIFLSFVPYLLIVVGSVIAVDAILTLVFAIIKKNNVKANSIAAVMTIVLAAISILLGALMVGNDPKIGKDVQFIVFGVILILFALLGALATFVSLPNLTKKDSVVVDAEVTVVEENKGNNEEKAE